ncbi:MAG: hypothetical protein JAZ05_09680, partial [Candidatus Thiodiazotropha taylori]|nr:hypothetical protein [Candidatus Thiodiazotropha taylori]
MSTISDWQSRQLGISDYPTGIPAISIPSESDLYTHAMSLKHIESNTGLIETKSGVLEWYWFDPARCQVNPLGTWLHKQQGCHTEFYRD